MKLKVLVDNNTYIDQYVYGEPAVSYYLEDEREKILLDVGYSDVLLHNAVTFGLDLGSLSTIVISHGHNDHTRGFTALMEQQDLSAVKVVAHPSAFHPKEVEGQSIGSPFSVEEMRTQCDLILTDKPMKISPHLFFLGEIPQYHDFEHRTSIGERRIGGSLSADFVEDDTAIAYHNKDGIFVISGCAHSGICNIIEHAKTVCNDDRILGVLGGFHLFEVTPQVEKTIAYFEKNRIKLLYPCHCVSFAVKAAIHQRLPIGEVGVGLTLEW